MTLVARRTHYWVASSTHSRLTRICLRASIPVVTRSAVRLCRGNTHPGCRIARPVEVTLVRRVAGGRRATATCPILTAITGSAGIAVIAAGSVRDGRVCYSVPLAIWIAAINRAWIAIVDVNRCACAAPCLTAIICRALIAVIAGTPIYFGRIRTHTRPWIAGTGVVTLVARCTRNASTQVRRRLTNLGNEGVGDAAAESWLRGIDSR